MTTCLRAEEGRFFRPARYQSQAAVAVEDRRCVSEQAGVRCGLPKGHYGMHQNSAFSYRIRPWSDGDARNQ